VELFSGFWSLFNNDAVPTAWIFVKQVSKMTRFTTFRVPLLAGMVAALLLAGWGAWAASPAYACSCIVSPPPQEALEDAEDVFAGEVLEITEAETDMYIDVRIRVDQTWKGVDDPEVTVRTPDNSAACGFYFEVGQEYLVYTSEMEGEIQVSLCSRTALLSDAGEDLDALGNGMPVGLPAAGASGDGANADDGIDTLVLGGSILGFLAIVGMITVLRRWR
jgi:hypothetical protein